MDPRPRGNAPQLLDERASHHFGSDRFIWSWMLPGLRHGDIDVASKRAYGNDTRLAERGEARALKGSGITRIVTSDSVRAQETAAPLAASLDSHLSFRSTATRDLAPTN